MFPRSSVDILASATSNSRRVSQRQTHSGFDGEIISFSLDSAAALSSTEHVGHHPCTPGPRSLQHRSGDLAQPAMLFHNFGPPEDGAARAGSSSIRRLGMGTTMLACSVFSPYTNKPSFTSSGSTSNPSSAGSQPAKMSRSERLAKAIGVLKDGWLSPFDLLLEVLDESNPEYAKYRIELYKEKSTKLSRILDHIVATESGKRKLWSWIQPHALGVVCQVIDDEMDSVTTEDILPGLSAIDPEFIKSWAVADVSEKAPFLTQVLCRAAQTSLAKEKNKKKHPDAVLLS